MAVSFGSSVEVGKSDSVEFAGNRRQSSNYAWDITTACDNYILGTRDNVALLASINIPVVASTGNDGHASGGAGRIGWPSRISGIVKVGSVNEITAALSSFSNTPNPTAGAHVGPIFMALGGNNVNSSVPTSFDPSGYFQSFGTSMAAPHVAGVYALAKAEYPSPWPIADITAWLVGNATVPMSVPIDIFDSSITAQVGRLVLPALPPK